MNISKYISDHNNDYQKKTLMRKIGLGLYLSPFVIALIPLLAALFIKKEGALAPFIACLGLLFIILPIIGLIIRVYSNKKYKNAEIIDKCIIHSYGSKTPGQLYEEVGVEIKDGTYYYYTSSEYDRMHAGGNSAKVPDEFVTGQDVNIEGLLVYIAKGEPYMESLQCPNSEKSKIVEKPSENNSESNYLQHMYDEYLYGVDEEGIDIKRFWEIVSAENLDRIPDGDGYGGYRLIEVLPSWDPCQPWTELLIEQNGKFAVTGTGERTGWGNVYYFNTKEKALAFFVARLRRLKNRSCLPQKNGCQKH